MYTACCVEHSLCITCCQLLLPDIDSDFRLLQTFQSMFCNKSANYGQPGETQIISVSVMKLITTGLTLVFPRTHVVLKGKDLALGIRE